MQRLIDGQYIVKGDSVCIRGDFNKDENVATIIDSRYVEYNSETLTINEWVKKSTGWMSVNVYENTVLLREELMLLYVAITRAKKNLYLCVPAEKFSFGQTERCQISRFLANVDNLKSVVEKCKVR